MFSLGDTFPQGKVISRLGITVRHGNGLVLSQAEKPHSNPGSQYLVVTYIDERNGIQGAATVAQSQRT